MDSHTEVARRMRLRMEAMMRASGEHAVPKVEPKKADEGTK